MKISFTVEITLPDVQMDSIVPDEAGGFTLTLSSGGRQAECHFDETGSDHGSAYDALLSLSGVHIEKIDQKPCVNRFDAQDRPPCLM